MELERWSQAPPRGAPQTRWLGRAWGTRDHRCRMFRWQTQGSAGSPPAFAGDLRGSGTHPGLGNKTSAICRGVPLGRAAGNRTENAHQPAKGSLLTGCSRGPGPTPAVAGPRVPSQDCPAGTLGSPAPCTALPSGRCVSEHPLPEVKQVPRPTESRSWGQACT